MKRFKPILANILTVLFTLSAFFIAGFIAVVAPATSRAFYKTQFRKHGTLEKVRAQAVYLTDEKAQNYIENLTEEQLLSLMNHTMRYCLYLEDDLNITVGGEKLEIFLDIKGETLNEGCTEITHMADCKKLFGIGIILFFVSVAVFIAALVLGIIFRKAYYLYCGKTVYITLGICLGVLAVIGIFAAINFDKAFTIFHEIFFNGKQWQFGYGVMIAMIGEIFTGLVPIIGIIWIGLLILTVVGVYLFNRPLRKQKQI